MKGRQLHHTSIRKWFGAEDTEVPINKIGL